MKPLGIKPTLDLTGGESVYCINEAQRRKTLDIFAQASADSPLVQNLERVRRELNRNEQAALAFRIIDELLAPKA